MITEEPSDPWLERWLSPSRFAVYLKAAGNDPERALCLYDWNARMSSACLRDIGHLELLIRNRYDVALQAVSPGWTDPNDALWSSQAGIQQTQARQAKSNMMTRQSLRLARLNSKNASHGHTVANLSFGFWSALTQSERESTLWTPALSAIFPGRGRGPVHDRMIKLNRFRNRLAHWEPVFSATTGLLRQLGEIDALFRSLDLDVMRWVSVHSSVLPTLDELPEPLINSRPVDYLGAVTGFNAARLAATTRRLAVRRADSTAAPDSTEAPNTSEIRANDYA